MKRAFLQVSERAPAAADELAKGVHKAAKEIGDNAEDIGAEATKSVDRVAKQVSLWSQQIAFRSAYPLMVQLPIPSM